MIKRMKLVPLLVSLFMATLLSGCVGAVVAGAAGAGAVINDSRSFAQMGKDTRISHDIGQILTNKESLKTSHIVVSSYKGMVFLGGEVPKPALKRQAEGLALKVANVKRVYNQIEIAPNSSIKQMGIDAWITANIKTRMLARKGLHSGSMKVLTEKGVVYLLGDVSHDQANLAVDVARRVDGVTRVVKLFDYRD